MEPSLLDALKKDFEATFGSGGRIHVVRAPGRVNLIGEHTDYNDGFVCPMAIEPSVYIAARARKDSKIRLVSTQFPQHPAEFAADATIHRGEPAWSNYPRGAAAMLRKAGITLVGMDALYTNTLPTGGGLSSSAAMEVGTARALLALTGDTMDPARLALLMQQAEHEYALVPCGNMDQMIVAGGKKGHAMLLDCRDLSKRFIPLNPADLRVVIVNSMVKHELTGGEYAQRRAQCEQGVAEFAKTDKAVKALRDVSPEQVESARKALGDVVYRRCRHVVGEIARTTEFGLLLEAGRFDQAGALMAASHASLRDDYQVSVPELDFLSDQAMTVSGVYGARMTGGGFGGCIVALARPAAVEPLSAHLQQAYKAKYAKTPAVYVTTATDGAAEVS